MEIKFWSLPEEVTSISVLDFQSQFFKKKMEHLNSLIISQCQSVYFQDRHEENPRLLSQFTVSIRYYRPKALKTPE